MHRTSLLLINILFLAPGFAAAQQTDASSAVPAPISRDPQALNLLSQSYQAMTGMTALQDATLQAGATWIAGSDEESGTATLEAKGSQEGRAVLSLSGGQRQEVRNALQGPQGAWAASDGTWYAISFHNCWTDASWFFPAFTLQTALNDPSMSAVYLGLDSFAGVPAIHLVLYRTMAGQSATTTSIIQRLSTTDVYLDTTSGLPLGFRFNAHPDNDAGTDIPVEVHFSNYKQVNGVQVPLRIQRFLQGSLLIDLSVTTAQVNSGLTDSNFAMPLSLATVGGGQ